MSDKEVTDEELYEILDEFDEAYFEEFPEDKPADYLPFRDLFSQNSRTRKNNKKD